MILDGLTPGERFVVEWQYGMLGHFGSNLAKTMERADGHNLARLRMGFPEEVDAMEAYAHQSGWWQDVQRKAGLA
jgi:hypothetical protein